MSEQEKHDPLGLHDETLADIAHEHHVNYTAIFGVLCLCTVLSIIFDLSKESMTKPLLIVLILAVAVCKATFVLLYFMHIKFERAWKYVLLAPTGVLACALPFALAPDMSFHYYTVVAPQQTILAAEHEAEAHHGGEHAPVAGAHGEDHHDHKAGDAKHDDKAAAGHKDKDHAPAKAAEKDHK